MAVLRPYRYSGNKARHLSYIKIPPGFKRLREVCFGSGSVSVNLGAHLECVGSDIDQRVVDLWNWLALQTEDSLNQLNQKYKKDIQLLTKPDIRTIPNLTAGERLYIKLNVCGVYTGQWSSWAVYTQHNLPIAKTIKALPRIKKIKVSKLSCLDYLYQDGDLIFFDPEYVGTSANYSKKAKQRSTALIESFLEINKHNPVIFTYGNDAKERFPHLNWEVGMKRKVPKIRTGGTLDRVEHIAYLNL